MNSYLLKYTVACKPKTPYMPEYEPDIYKGEILVHGENIDEAKSKLHAHLKKEYNNTESFIVIHSNTL